MSQSNACLTADVMEICDALEQRLSIKTIEPFNDYVGVRCGHNERIEIDLTNKTVTKFDKTAYQRKSGQPTVRAR